ncbi:hypothetical protein Q3304_08275 [Clostridioides sp. GD02377]|uniref:hypothetical protein n=1 Tax=unclassified Clostridioides TaxID=2635829 RepID=UPI0038A8BF19
MIKSPFYYTGINDEIYGTIGVSEPTKQSKLQKIYDENLERNIYKYECTNKLDKSTNSTVAIYKDKKNNYYHDKEQNQNKLVIYTTATNYNDKFIMDLKEFIHIIDEKTTNIAFFFKIVILVSMFSLFLFLKNLIFALLP